VIVLTGKPGALLRSIAAALRRGSRASVSLLPLTSRLLTTVGKPNVGAVVVLLSSEKEIEPIRWMARQAASVPIFALLSKADARLRRRLLSAGAAGVVELPSLKTGRARQKLDELAAMLPSQTARKHSAEQRIAADLHAARSALTAVLGNTELALQSCPRSSPLRKQLRGIVHGVSEIEEALRRMERTLQLR
jgi:hypothetical protein